MEDRHVHSHKNTCVQSAVLVSFEASTRAAPPLMMRKTDTGAKLSLSPGLITFVIEVLAMGLLLPQLWAVVLGGAGSMG